MPQENFFEIVYSIETEQQAKEIYDRWAEVYDQDLNKSEYQQPKRCADALAKTISEKEGKILDVGCGTGLSGMALHNSGFKQIDGCDLSPGMLSKAGQLNIYERLFETNLNEPPIDAADGTYDAITAVGVFSFGHVLADAVDEFIRVSKRGAPIIFGLNDHYYDEGSLIRKLEGLQKESKLHIVSQEHGEHIPGNDLMGWVITAVNTAA